MLVRLAQDADLFGGAVPCETHLCMSTPVMAAIDADTSAELTVTRNLLVTVLHLPREACTERVCREAQRVVALVRERGARLVAAALAAVVRRQCAGAAPQEADASIVVALDGGAPPCSPTSPSAAIHRRRGLPILLSVRRRDGASPGPEMGARRPRARRDAHKVRD